MSNIDFTDGAQFDPGFAQHITVFEPGIKYIYSAFENFKNFGQKKLQFKLYYPKLQSMLTNHIAFYLGCMLWAAYIQTQKGKPVLNNLCYGAEYDETETLEEVDFMLEFVDKFPKDVKYYLGQNFSLDSASINIIEAYREFLKLNKGFTQAQTTDDIKLPANLHLRDAEAVLNKIESVVETGKLTELYGLYEQLF